MFDRGDKERTFDCLGIGQKCETNVKVNFTNLQAQLPLIIFYD